MKLTLIDRGLASPSVPFFTACGICIWSHCETLVAHLMSAAQNQVEGVESSWVGLTHGQLCAVWFRWMDLGSVWDCPYVYEVAPAVATSPVLSDAILGRLDDAILTRTERQ